MQISEAELRAMIRDAIARHGSGSGTFVSAPPDAAAHGHSSHLVFALVPSGEEACIIEPSVPCNHCGYCKSLGH
jgi:hypothetical protein